MSSAFSEALSKLRQSRGVSQRTAASDLGVSQALLSHYENGIREPGLDFVCRACDYYEVSSDYILGRSAHKKEVGGVPMRTEANAPEFQVSELAETDRRLISDTLTVINEVLAQTGDRQVMNDALAYMSLSALRLFNDVDSRTAALMAGVDSENLDLRCDAALSVAQLGLRQSLAGNKDIHEEALDEKYPETFNSLMQVLYYAGMRIKRI